MKRSFPSKSVKNEFGFVHRSGGTPALWQNACPNFLVDFEGKDQKSNFVSELLNLYKNDKYVYGIKAFFKPVFFYFSLCLRQDQFDLVFLFVLASFHYTIDTYIPVWIELMIGSAPYAPYDENRKMSESHKRVYCFVL